MLVSIIIPVFNREAQIGRTLQSLFDQSYEHWECLVVDDGSTDTTIDVVTAFAKADTRIHLFERPTHKPKGANACRNIGITQAKGDFMMFLDSDDTLIPRALENRIKAATEYPLAAACIFSTQVILADGSSGSILNKDPEKELAKEYLKMFLSYKIPWQISSPFWKATAVKNALGFDEQLQRFQDVDFHTMMLLQGIQLQRIHTADFEYRMEEGGSSKYNDPAFIRLAVSQVTQYVTKYYGEARTEVLSDLERKRLLRVMMRKLYTKFVRSNKDRGALDTFVKAARGKHVFEGRAIFWVHMLWHIEHGRLKTLKGVGLYRLRKWILKGLPL